MWHNSKSIQDFASLLSMGFSKRLQHSVNIFYDWKFQYETQISEPSYSSSAY